MAEAKLHITAVDETRAAFDRVKRAVSEVESGFGRLSAGASRFGALLTGGTVAAGFIAITRATIEGERAQNRLAAALKTTGHAAGVTRTEIEAMVEALSQSTAFDDDEIRQGITSLLRFRDIQGDVFRDAVRLGPDLAAALDTNLIGAYQRLARAIQDPATGMRGLRDAGVRLSESQLDLAKNLALTGDAAGSARVVIDALKASVGGSAGAENVGLYKGTRETAKGWDDLLKALGRNADSPINRVLGGATALLRDMKLTVEGVHSPFTQLILDAAEFADKLSLGSTALFGTSDLLRRMVTQSSRSGRIATPTADRISALQGQIDAAQERAAAQATERARSERANIMPVLVSGEVESQRAAVNRTRQVLDEYHRDGLIAERDYYAQRRDLVETGLRAELKSIENSLDLARIRGREAINRVAADQAQAEIIKLIQRRSQVQQDAAQANVLASIEEARAARKFRDELVELNAELLELQGRSAAAAGLRFDAQNRRTLEFADANSANPDARQAADILAKSRERVVLQAQLAEAGTEADQVQQRLFNREVEVDALRRRGAISELEAMNRTSEARRAAVIELEQLRDVYERLAAAADPSTPAGRAIILQAETVNARLRDLEASADVLGTKLQDVSETALSGFFKDILSGTEKAGNAFRKMKDRIKSEIDDLVASTLAHDFLALFGLQGGAAGGGSGSILADIFFGGRGRPGTVGGLRLPPGTIDESGAFGRGGLASSALGVLFGSAGTPGLQGPTPSGGNISGGALGGVFDFFRSLFGFASGGSFTVGGSGVTDSQLVMFRARPDERVTVQTPAQRQRAGGNVINVSINVPGAVDRRSADQIAALAGAAVQRALARNT